MKTGWLRSLVRHSWRQTAKAARWSGKSDSAATVFASRDDAEEEADKK